MGINAKQLKELVIRPTLVALGMDLPAWENLLLLTCAQESQMGTYLHQVNGIALGIYQIEPKTHEDIWYNYLSFKATLSAKISQLGKTRDNNQLVWNLAYSTAMALMVYDRHQLELPEADDIEGLAKIYKLIYNTPRGSATVESAIDNYKRYVP